ncbi:MAG: hypothetical protein DHS20C18_30930 [Saprospiraceae bacterium]|nr:MAG: hypothetical protein DHS20C18_30930 [Saprospiraceae bacterium]
MLAAPFATSKEAIAASALFQDQRFTVQDNTAMLLLFALAGLTALIAIFLFKNRILQSRLSLLAAITTLAGAAVALIIAMQDKAIETATASIEYGFGMALPILTIIFAVLASRFIRKDEKLVKSMDRLR